LLDVGCGDGGVAQLLRQGVAEVVAVDIEPSDKWADADGISFSVANAEQLPFGDDEFRSLALERFAAPHGEPPASDLCAALSLARFGVFEAHTSLLPSASCGSRTASRK